MGQCCATVRNGYSRARKRCIAFGMTAPISRLKPFTSANPRRSALLIGSVVRRQFDGDFEHVLRVEGDPRRAVGLLQITPRGQWRAAVEDADIVEPEKASFVEIAAVTVFPVDPPAEIRTQLAKDPL